MIRVIIDDQTLRLIQGLAVTMNIDRFRKCNLNLRVWPALALVALGCGGGGGGSQSTNDPPVLKPNVVIAGSGIEVVSSDENSVVVSGNASVIAPGTTLVSGTGPGLLRKVVSVTPSGSNTLLGTSQGALEDVFESANISEQVSMGADEVEDFEPALPGVTLDSPSLAPGRSETSIKLTLHEVTLEQEGSAKISVSGSIVFTIDVRLVYRVPQNYVEIVATIDGSADATLKASLSKSFADRKWLLGTLKSKPLIIMAGPVPIVLVPKLDIYSALDGSLKLGASVTGSSSYSLRLGAFKSDVDMGGIGSLSHEEHLTQTPNFYGSCEFRYTPLRVDLGVFLYGVAGPYVKAEIPGFDLTFAQKTNPAGKQITLGGGFTGSAGLKLKMFNHASLDYEFPNVINTRFDILDQFFPDNGGVDVEVK